MHPEILIVLFAAIGYFLTAYDVYSNPPSELTAEDRYIEILVEAYVADKMRLGEFEQLIERVLRGGELVQDARGVCHIRPANMTTSIFPEVQVMR